MIKVLMIHPEGNISNNPNLSGIVELLCEQGYKVEIKSARKLHYQVSPDSRAVLILDKYVFLSKIKLEIFKRVNSFFLIKALYFIFFKQKKANYQLLIGVDRDGIIEARLLSDAWQIPYAFISYEIFFEAEAGNRFKEIERKACGKVVFAISQDPLRAKILARQNNIPIEKIITIPVAGRKIVKGQRLYSLHKKFGISRSKKIALIAGSIDKWTMVEELVDNLNLWPDDWVIVLHDRYGSLDHSFKEKISGSTRRLFISDRAIDNQKEMYKLLHAVDLGIAFYKPTYESIYTGLNIKYMGFSSGKIATYLQHGLPVLMNDVGEISNLMKAEGVGIVIKEFSEISSCLEQFDLENYRDRCFDFFDKYLSLERNAAGLLALLDAACSESFQAKGLPATD